MYKRDSERTRQERLDELIEEARVDCHNEHGQETGSLTMIEDNVVCPSKAKVIGEGVGVIGFEQPETRGLKAVCRYKGKDNKMDITPHIHFDVRQRINFTYIFDEASRALAFRR